MLFSKKSILIIVIIVLIVICAFSLYSESQVKLGSVYVSAPLGYHAETNSNGVVNLTNNDNSFLLNEYSVNSTDVEASVNYYKETKEKENVSVDLEKFNVDNVNIYKTKVNNGTEVYHYWFSNNGKIYEFVTLNGNQYSDGIVSDLIKSMKNSKF